MDLSKDQVNDLRDRITEIYSQIGAKGEEFELMLNQLREIKEEFASLTKLPSYSEYKNIYTSVSKYIDLETQGMFSNDASTIQEMSDYINNLKADLDSANDIIQSILPLKRDVLQRSFDYPALEERLDTLESRLSVVELRISHFHDELCVLVAEFSNIISRINQHILNTSVSFSVCYYIRSYIFYTFF